PAARSTTTGGSLTRSTGSPIRTGRRSLKATHGRRIRDLRFLPMSEKSLVALKVGPSTTELREFDLPEIAADAALLKVEVAGVCGTDVSQYKLPLRGAPLIMGHENVGYLAKV